MAGERYFDVPKDAPKDAPTDELEGEPMIINGGALEYPNAERVRADPKNFCAVVSCICVHDISLSLYIYDAHHPCFTFIPLACDRHRGSTRKNRLMRSTGPSQLGLMTLHVPQKENLMLMTRSSLMTLIFKKKELMCTVKLMWHAK